MKNWIWMILIIGLLAGGIASLHLPKEDFQIYNSMKCSFDNYVDVTLQVIVNRQNYDVQEIFEVSDELPTVPILHNHMR